MTDKLRARARELAETVYWNPIINQNDPIDAIEAAILQFAREALSEEPDEAMLSATYAAWGEREVYKSMAEARARGLE